MKKTLLYLSQFFGFGIADEEITAGVVIELDAEAYRLLGADVPDENAPKIGFLLGREKGHYTIDFPYAWATVRARKNVRLIGLDYLNCEEQLAECDALILPGGAFESPERYYVDASEDAPKEGFPNIRSEAYVKCLCAALAAEKPVLGICAGAQIIAAEFGGLLGRDYTVRESSTKVIHKRKERYAHLVISKGNTPLSEVMCQTYATACNSRHKEFLAELSPLTGLSIYAFAEDMVPEAWGSVKDKVLAVQWHPEDYALAGDKRHAGIYAWLADEAMKYKTLYADAA